MEGKKEFYSKNLIFDRPTIKKRSIAGRSAWQQDGDEFCFSQTYKFSSEIKSRASYSTEFGYPVPPHLHMNLHYVLIFVIKKKLKVQNYFVQQYDFLKNKKVRENNLFNTQLKNKHMSLI
jgi:hypothetical protein